MARETRRKFLIIGGTVGSVSLAGCLSAARDYLDGGAAAPPPPLEDDDDDPEIEDDDDDFENGDDDEDEEEEEPEDEPDDEGDLPGEPIDDFEDLAEWFAFIDQGSIEPETDDVYAGSQSARIEAGGEIDTATVFREFPGSLDLSGKNLSMAVKFSGRDILDITVQLIAPNSRNFLNMRRVLMGPEGQWTRVDFGANREETQPDLFDVREIRILGRRRGDDDDPIEFIVDDLRAVDTPDSGYVILLFDGTLASHYNTALPIMLDYGFPGVEAVTPELVDGNGRLMLDEMRQMRDAGWDMIARPHVGPSTLSEFSRDEQEGLIRRTHTYLVNRGFEDGAQHFFTPRNIMSPEAREILPEYHEQAFRFGVAPNGLPITDPHNIGYFSGRDGNVTKQFVTLASRYNQLAVLRFTEIGEDGLSVEAFEDVLDHIEATDIEVITATDLLGL